MNPYIENYKINTIKTELSENITHYKKIEIETCPDFTIFHVNIRSISKNIDELLIFLSQFNKEFDIIALSETFQIFDTSIYNINGYKMLYNQGTLNKNDGVIIYIRSNYVFQQKIDKIGEINAITLDVKLDQNNTVVVTTLYRPPSTNVYSFNTNLLNYITNLNYRGTHILVGDININILSEENDFVQDYLNTLCTHGYISYINDYTRIHNESKACIDHFFVKTENLNTKIRSIIFKQNITDHFPTMLLLKFGKKVENKRIPLSFKKYINYKKIKQDLQNEKWTEIYNSEDVDHIAQLLTSKLQATMEINTKLVKIKRADNIRKEWITPALVKSINKKNEMYKKCVKYPYDEQLLAEYKTYKNKLIHLVQKAKKEYYSLKITQNKNNSQNLWQTVNKMCNKKQNQNSTDKIINENNKILLNKYDIANAFVDYYSELGARYAKQINVPLNYDENNRTLENSFFLRQTNTAEVKNTIKLLKLRKSPGYDNIRSEVLKQVADEIAEPLTYIFNKSITKGQFPRIFKFGLIKPLHKGGDPTEMSNYRPISVISNIAKVYEKILKSRFVKYIEKYQILSDRQHGFRNGRSTEDAIARLTQYIYNAMDTSTPCACIFLDLAKAFDTICHKKMFNKLYNYGFRGNVLNLIKSYFTDRTQFVNIEGKLSYDRKVNYGVPQGTVLGPVFFILYMNSILELNIEGTMLSFADDTAVLYTSESWGELKIKMEKDLKKIKRSFDYNLLTINYKKSHYLPFTSYTNYLPNMGPLLIDINAKILEAESIKYLGIIIDRHLRWNLQIQNLVKKIRYLLPRFKYLKNFLSQSELKILYYSLVQSHLSYGILGWGGVTDNYLNHLNTIQKWVLKIIYNKNLTYPTSNLYNECGVLDLRQLFFLYISIYTHKNKNSITNIEHKYNTRYKQNSCFESRSEKTIGQRNYTYLSPRVYNKLPNDIKIIKKIHVFKKKVKLWLLETPRQDIYNLINQNILA